jgi:hypothetical protein
MSDDKYTADELAFVDMVMIAAITGLAGDSEYPLEKIPERARSLAVAALAERRKLRGPVLVLDEEGARRLARLDAFYADAYRLVGFTNTDPGVMRTNSVLMNLENNRSSLHECSSELANMIMTNDALKRQNSELMTQVSPSTRAVLVRAATLIENLAEAVDDPVLASQSKEEAAQIRTRSNAVIVHSFEVWPNDPLRCKWCWYDESAHTGGNAKTCPIVISFAPKAVDFNLCANCGEQKHRHAGDHEVCPAQNNTGGWRTIPGPLSSEAIPGDRQPQPRGDS